MDKRKSFLSRIFLAIVLIFAATPVFAEISAKPITVMFYNLENLFDSIHDQGKSDWEFVPFKNKGKRAGCSKVRSYYYRRKCFSTDWTEGRIKLKINQISRLLTYKGRTVPDILAVAEIENKRVASMLARKLGYSSFEITNSPDKRGIDVALFYSKSSAIKILSWREHVLSGKEFAKKKTRNILQVTFLYRGYKLAIFVNHWPSPAAPAPFRIAAAKVLRSEVKKLLASDRTHHVIALGDFNVVNSEASKTFDAVLTGSGTLQDVRKIFNQSKKVSLKLKQSLPMGTMFYPPKKSWDHLDRIFVGKRLLDGKELDIDVTSFRIYAPDIATVDYTYKKGKRKGQVVSNIPKRYNHNAGTPKNAGYSDHFPVSVQLVVK